MKHKQNIWLMYVRNAIALSYHLVVNVYSSLCSQTFRIIMINYPRYMRSLNNCTWINITVSFETWARQVWFSRHSYLVTRTSRRKAKLFPIGFYLGKFSRFGKFASSNFFSRARSNRISIKNAQRLIDRLFGP